MTTNDVSLRMVRSRSQQAQIYARIDTPPEPQNSGYQPRSRAITLPTLKSVYGGRRVPRPVDQCIYAAVEHTAVRNGFRAGK